MSGREQLADDLLALTACHAVRAWDRLAAGEAGGRFRRVSQRPMAWYSVSCGSCGW